MERSAAGFDWRGTGELAGRRASKVRRRETWGSDSRTISDGERTVFYRSVMRPVIDSIGSRY